MKFTNLAKCLFNQSDVFASLLVIQESNNPIYKDDNLSVKLGKISDIAYRTVMVDKIIGNDLYKIKFNNSYSIVSVKNIDYLILLPKSRVQVKVSSSLQLDKEVNLIIRAGTAAVDQIRGKICYSSHYAIYKDKLYETVIYKGEVIAFVSSEDLTILHNQNIRFKITDESTVFKNSDMTKPFEKTKLNSKIYESQLVNKENDSVRFKYKGKNVWLPISRTNLKVEIEEYVARDISESVIKSIVDQYDAKLKNSNSYYLNLLNRELKR